MGADVLVLDDGLQHPGIRAELRIAVVATEQDGLSPWPVPAGPWRQGIGALSQADLVVVTRKTASRQESDALGARLARSSGRPVLQARLALGALQRLHGGDLVPAERLRGRRLLAVTAIADPGPFRDALEALGAHVRLRARRDHAAFGAGTVGALVEESRASDYVVVTFKDAMKLRTRWPAQPDPLVAELVVHWEVGAAVLCTALDRLLPHARADMEPPADRLPTRQ
jgi:tetraacyldisaccharide 4'-kinase